MSIIVTSAQRRQFFLELELDDDILDNIPNWVSAYPLAERDLDAQLPLIGMKVTKALFSPMFLPARSTFALFVARCRSSSSARRCVSTRATLPSRRGSTQWCRSVPAPAAPGSSSRRPSTYIFTDAPASTVLGRDVTRASRLFAGCVPCWPALHSCDRPTLTPLPSQH